MPRTFVVVLLFALLPWQASGLILPPEGLGLSQIHVQFEWEPVAGATSYDLQIVIDAGGGDPFSGATPVVDINVDASEPRALVKSGLAFDDSYAWRVRGDDGTPMPWSATSRFDIVPIPADLPDLTATHFGGSMQPGLTLFNLRDSGMAVPGTYAIAVDEVGDVVGFVFLPLVFGDLRLLDDGRLLISTDGVAMKVTLSGQMAWRSRDEYFLHHEIFPMPNGDLLTIDRRERPVTYGGTQKIWKGDAIVIINPSNWIIWEWNTFDELSYDDRDEELWTTSTTEFDWTHTNGAIYDPVTDDIYVSIRHLSRIVRIDRTSRSIVYSMGFDMPSGDVDFGDNLFSWQHSPELQPNGNLLLYDNGNRRDHMVHDSSTGVTKAVEVAFAAGDPPTSAGIVWEWTVPTYNVGVGDADRQPNGNTLVVAGRTDATAIHEVDPTGFEVWRLAVTSKTGGIINIYRAERIDELVLDVPGDVDGDGYADFVDNCPDHANPDQEDEDGDGFGDVCALAIRLVGDPPDVDIELVPALPVAGAVALAALLCAAGALALRGGAAAKERTALPR